MATNRQQSQNPVRIQGNIPVTVLRTNTGQSQSVDPVETRKLKPEQGRIPWVITMDPFPMNPFSTFEKIFLGVGGVLLAALGAKSIINKIKND